MSNYTITTNFGAKDVLLSGNPLKLILGAQLTTEFSNLVTAIASKFDAAATNIVFNDTAGMQLGSPTGGAQGANTLNVQGAVYQNGVPLRPMYVAAVNVTNDTKTNNASMGSPDPLLSVAATAGTYAYKAILNISGGAGGIQSTVSTTGTYQANSGGMICTGSINQAAINKLSLTGNGINNGYAFATCASGDWLIYEGYCVLTSAGTVGVAWAQNSSNAAGTTLNPGSVFMLTKVA